MKTFPFFVAFALILALGLIDAKERFRPYEVLGIKRGATQQEVKKAYRRLVKEAHPDKNKAPDAQDKFVQITRAYELLSDPERRRNYDNHGVTEDTPNFNKKHDYSQYNRFGDPFDHLRDLFGDNFNQFKQGGNRENIFHKQSVTYKAYANTLVPNSYKQPYLILFYSDWCFSCAQVIPMWSKLVEELEPVGFGLATVHTEHERELARKVGVKELPHLVLLTDGKVTHYRESMLSVVKVLEFIRRKLPYKLVQRINDDNVGEFLNGWMDNRVRVLIFGKLDIVRLRYLTSGFKFRERAAIGYVQVTSARIANRMIELSEVLRDNITKDELIPAASLVLTVAVIIAGGYVMSYLVKIEEENVQKQLGARGLKVDRKGKVVPELKIHELRAETYNGMIRLLKPGCRTVVLIVDRESKEKLVAKFYKHAWPFRRNKTLMFGFMYIEKGLSWYKKILNLTLPEPRDIKINPKNCIGTVLSLNGHRRYFCMYHAKHPEATRRPGYYTARQVKI